MDVSHIHKESCRICKHLEVSLCDVKNAFRSKYKYSSSELVRFIIEDKNFKNNTFIPRFQLHREKVA